MTGKHFMTSPESNWPANLTQRTPRTLRSAEEALEEQVRKKTGGEGGIRTPDTLSGMAAFEAARFNRSRTSPRQTQVRPRIAGSCGHSVMIAKSPARAGRCL